MKSWLAPVVPRVEPEAELPRVFDTASGGLMPVGSDSGTARLYVCGITPYDATHMGHAFTYVTFDLLNRVWRDAGLDVSYVQNITDVDDPLLERAAATGVDWEDLATSQIDLFRSDMEALRVLPPDHYIGVTECLDRVVALVESMIDSGSVYQVDGEHRDWYFNCSGVEGFGQVGHLPREEALRVFAERGGDPDRPGKRDPLDCLVWRQARPGEPSWDSPLGKGRPGWHIECTAIALEYLGKQFDVQGGGSDLIFPHHEMCAAQALVATREPLARAFVHSAMVGLDGEKMSKSKGNLVLVSTLLGEGVDPMAIRLALLDHHYRTDWFWTQGDLERSTARLAVWRQAVGRSSGADAATVVAEVRTAQRDDLDSPAALLAVDAWAEATLAGNGSDSAAPGIVAKTVDALLGVDLSKGIK